MEYSDKPINVLFRRVLAPDLRVKSIVPKCVVGRAGYGAMDAFIGQFPQSAEGVPVDDYVCFYASLTSSGFVVITR